MGLLDNILGAATQALGSQQAQGDGPNWMALIAGLLANGSAQGGLAGLLQQLQAGGLGEQLQSWISTGGNLPVSADQLSSALGGAGGLLGQLAQQAGVSPAEAGSQLSQWLPQIIDMLTPDGQLPQQGAGAAGGGLGDLAGMLGGLLGGQR
ncbi:MAG: YidB family protein [Roseateles sp.]|uniref:YidB family protein n=1 Tax=Roseateles sp. TaxID=1971397 RepID=UPI0039EB2F96